MRSTWYFPRRHCSFPCFTFELLNSQLGDGAHGRQPTRGRDKTAQ
jgi:hypothetical protein